MVRWLAKLFRNSSLKIVYKRKQKKSVSSFCTDALKTQDDTGKASMSDVDGEEEKTPFDSTSRGTLHKPVLVEEVLHYLEPCNEKVFIDMTFGAGGHTQEILKKAPGIKIYALDRDPFAYSLAKELAQKSSPNQIIPLLGRFSDLIQLLESEDLEPGTVDGFLFDVGASSMQFDQSMRGFSLSKDGPLDMRMDGDRIPNQPSAAHVVNNMDEADLHKIIRKYGEERMSRKIAHAIIECRYAFGRIIRTKQLADIISSVFVQDFKQDKLMRQAHVATKTFQALRIFVNNELNEINNGLEIAHHYLKPGGVCVGVSFHSLEDRIFKRHFHGLAMDAASNMSISDHFRQSSRGLSQDIVEKAMKKKWLPIEKKVIKTSYEESQMNPRSRSAKLRAAKKLDV